MPNSDKESSKNDNRLPVFAALDLGTNNCRLLIARPGNSFSKMHHNLKILDSFSKIVRLGENLSDNNRFSQEAMSRTISALKTCKKKLDRFENKFVRMVATEACRKSENSDEFLDAVYNETGLEIEIISNEDEATLAFLGCSSLLFPDTDNALVFDIGGGSTEFMYVKRDYTAPPELLCEHRIVDWLSLDQGVMNLSERFGGTAFVEMYFDELVGHLVKGLRAFDRKNKISERVASGSIQMISTSGTLTTLAAIHLQLDRYERNRIDGVTFSMDDLRDVTQNVLAMTLQERLASPCIGNDRSDYIISGCAIFEAICSLWPVDKITIADRGVREGIIISLMQKYMRTII